MKKTGQFSALCLAAIAGLSACASTSSDYLMNGIDPAKTASLNKTVGTTNTNSAISAPEKVSSTAELAAGVQTPAVETAQKPENEVCEQFYKNAEVYLRDSQKSVNNQVALAQMGVGILSTVATGGLGGLGISSATGQLLAQQLTGTGLRLGGAMAINGINKNSGPVAKVVEAANELGCSLEFIDTAESAQKTP